MSNLEKETIEATKIAVLSDASFVPQIVEQFNIPTMEMMAAQREAQAQAEQLRETRLQALENGRAPLNSPAFTGVPTAQTAAAGTNTTQLATTAFVAAAVAQLINSSPGALDTLKELADAIGNDPTFAATIANQLALKLSKSANLSDLTDKAAARLALGLVALASSGEWADIKNVPDGTTQQKGIILFAANGNATAGRGVLATDKRVNEQRQRVSTQPDGTLTWQYPTPFAAGVVPVVSCEVEAPAGSTATYRVQIQGAPSNTSASFKVVKDNPTFINVLGITVLGVPVSAGAVMCDLTAGEPTQ